MCLNENYCKLFKVFSLDLCVCVIWLLSECLNLPLRVYDHISLSVCPSAERVISLCYRWYLLYLPIYYSCDFRNVTNSESCSWCLPEIRPISLIWSFSFTILNFDCKSTFWLILFLKKVHGIVSNYEVNLISCFSV